jgi:hypothetical protein
VLFLLAAGEKFDGFHGVSLVALVAAGVVAAVWALLFGLRWAASFPRLPDAGPETSDLGPEPPAVANLLVNRWKVTRTAIPATLLDLAARRVVGIDLVGHDNYVVRLRDGDSTREKLTDYEQQVLDLVKARATGGSCPVEALDLGEPDYAAGWVKKFDKRVASDARSRGLARSRWRTVDWVIIGGGLSVVFGLLASAFALAHLAEGTGTTDKWAREDWFWVGGVAWLLAMFAISRTQDLRDTRDGQAACARWLGVRNYFRNAHSFDNAQAASVIIWERNLSYGVGLGAAHEAAHDLPFIADDPGEAWTRHSGSWRQVRVESPKRFGYGQPPFTVFLGGLGRVALWGAIGFVALPIVGRILWDLADTGLSRRNQQDWGMAIVGGFIALFSIVGTYLAVRFLAGVIRLWRGAADLGKAVTVEGEVVKVYQGCVALDDGRAEELAALVPGVRTQSLARGMKARITMTPRLHYVKAVEILEGAVPGATASPKAPGATATAPAGE